MNKKIYIEVHKLFFIVKFLNRDDNHRIDSMCNNLTSFSFEWNKVIKRFIRKKNKEYFVYDVRTNEFRFPIKTLKNFMYLLAMKGYSKDDIGLKVFTDYDIEAINTKTNPKYVLRDYQKDYVNVVLNGKEPLYLIDAYTGSGKGIISSTIMCRLNKRAVILVLPKFVDKWILDIKEYTNVIDEDLCVIQGSESLINLMLETDIKYKFIIISLRTFSNYLTDYETPGKEFQYPIKPQDFMKHIKAGILYNDETHLHFHSISHAMLYLDAYLMLGSTATFDSNEKTIKKLYDTIIPNECRVSNLVKREPYVECISVRYELRLTSKIKYKRRKGYSHTLYEQSIMKSHLFLYNYEEMILLYVEREYIKRRIDGDKCLIFFATVDMCTHFSKILKNKYPDLNVMRYCEDDPYENIITGDITCSTVLSSGTAIDIPNLITVIQTISIFSLQSNLQSFGRLRKLDDRIVKFIWFWTHDIVNQRRLHQERYYLLKDSMKLYTEEVYNKILQA